MPALWIADALRAGGCSVDETLVPDWKSRGHTDGPRMDTVVGVMGHHTAGGASGNLPSLGTVRDGRPDLAGPLANLMLSRAGVWVPIAAGRAWHAGDADNPAAWPWVPNVPGIGRDANGSVLGIEAESAGTGDWTPAQLVAYPRGVAALLHHQGLPASRFLGHLEWAPSRKVDPAHWPAGMAGFRATVTTDLQGADMPLTPADVAAIWQSPGDPNFGPTWIADRIIATNQRTDEVSTKVDALVGAVTALLKATPATPAAGAAGGIDYARIITGVADELDRRARDNNPATGPVS